MTRLAPGVVFCCGLLWFHAYPSGLHHWHTANRTISLLPYGTTWIGDIITTKLNTSNTSACYMYYAWWHTFTLPRNCEIDWNYIPWNMGKHMYLWSNHDKAIGKRDPVPITKELRTLHIFWGYTVHLWTYVHMYRKYLWYDIRYTKICLTSDTTNI